MKRFLALLATGAFAVGLSTSAHAQITRSIGAQALILDDNQTPAHKIIIETPQPGSQSYIDWDAAGFPPLQWSVPVPPVAGAQSGFIYPGPQNVSSGPVRIPYWIYPGETSSLSGAPVDGGTTGTWSYATAPDLGVATTASGTDNAIAKFNSPTNLVNSGLFDDGSTLSYGSGRFTVSSATGNTNISGTVMALGSGTFAGLNASSLGLANAGAISGATTITASSSVTLTGIGGLGVVHSSAGGVLTSSPIVDGDITNGTISNAKLVNPSVTVNTGASLTGGGSLPLGGALTLNTAQDIQTTASPTFTGETLTGIGGTGVVHSGAGGALSSSLIVNGDITNGTISNAKLVNPSVTVNTGASLTGGGSLPLGGALTLNTAQDIQTSASPTFAGETLTGIGGTGVVHSSAGGALSSSLLVNGDITPGTIQNASLANSSVTVTAGSGLSGGGAVALGGATTLAANINHDATLTGNGGSSSLGIDLTHPNTWTGAQHFNGANTIQYTDGNEATGRILTSDASGHASWADITVTSLTGTANQVLVNGTSGTPQIGVLTIATPQDIGMTSTPTFAGETLNGTLNLSSNPITNVTDPVAAQDAATKNYVDNAGTAVLAQAVIRAPGSTDRNAIQPTGDFVPLTLVANATQTNNLQEWQSSGGAVEASVSPTGLGTFAGLNAATLGVSNAGAISGATTITASSSVTLTGIGGLGVVHSSAGGVLTSSPIVDGDITNGTISNAKLVNPSVTVNTGASLTGGGSLPLGGALTLNTAQDIQTSASPTFAGETLTGIGGTGVVHSGAGGALSSSQIVDGDITNGTISNAKLVNPSVTVNTGASLTGGGSLPLGGALTLNTAQDIQTSASPTFAGETLNGTLNLSSNPITNVTDPVAAQDAATKNYVDNAGTAVLAQAVIRAPGSTDRNAIQPTGDFVPLTLVANATQTNNLQEWQSSGGAVEASVSPTGLGTFAGLNAATLGVSNAGAISGATTITASSSVTLTGIGGLGVVHSSAGGVLTSSPIVDGDITNGTISNAKLVNPSVTVNTGASLTGGGSLPLGGALTLNTAQDIQTSASPTFAGETLNGTLNLSSNPITNVTDPVAAQDAATKNYVDNAGTAVLAQAVIRAPGSTDRNAIQPTGDFVPLTLVANATQTNNLQEWQSSGGAVEASVSPTGLGTFAGLNAATLGVSNAGAISGATTITASSSVTLTGIGGLGVVHSSAGGVLTSSPIVDGDITNGTISNAKLVNPSVTVNTGASLTGGGSLPLGGALTLNTAQDIQTTASPTFAGETLTGIGGTGVVHSGAGGALSSSQIVDGDITNGTISNAKLVNPSVTVNTGASLTGGGSLPLGGALTLNTAQDIQTTASPTFAGETLTGIGGTGVVHSGAGGALSSSQIVDGDITNGTISNAKLVNPSVTVNTGASLTGGGSLPLGGALTLNTAQDIQTSASPTFAGETLNGTLNLSSNPITNVTDPVAAQDAATKNYVDNAGTAVLAQAVIRAPGSTDRNAIQPTGDFVPLTLVANATQTNNLQEWQSSGGAVEASVSPTGLGTFAGLNAATLGVSNAGAISGATTITASSSVTLTGIGGLGVVHSSAGGVLTSSPIVDGDITNGTISNAKLVNPSVTVNTGASLTGGGSLPLGGALTLNTAQDIQTTASPTFAGETLTGIGGTGVVHSGAGGALSSSQIVDGDITNGTISNAKLVNPGVTVNTGASLTGGGSLPLGGALTLNTAQDIQTTASPTFAGETLTGTLNLSSNPITNVTDPVAAQDAATKNYVDNAGTAVLAQAVILAPGSSARNMVQPTGDFVPLTLMANATQTNNLQEWQSSGGAVEASVSPTGLGTFAGLNAATLGVSNAGAISGATTITASSSVTLTGIGGLGVVHSSAGGVLTSSPIVDGDITPGTISNASLANSSVTVTAGSGLSGGGAVALGGATSLAANINHDATLTGNGGSSSLGIDLTHPNTWTGAQHFNGANTIQYTDGNQATGKVLISDASGNASWGNAGVTTVTGTANQVLVNGTSGTAQLGPLTLTTPQDIGTSSTPTFSTLTLSGTGPTINMTNAAPSVQVPAASTLTFQSATPSTLATLQDIGGEGFFHTTGDITADGDLTVNGPGDAAINIPNGGITSGTPGLTSGTLTLADGTGGSTYHGTLETAPLTADRTYLLPDREGTFFATTSIANYTDIVLLQPSSIQEMVHGTADGIEIAEQAGATGEFMVFYDPSLVPLFSVGNTGNVITEDYINISNTTSTSSITSGAGIPTTLNVGSNGGSGTVGVNIGTTGSAETALNLQSTTNDLILLGQTQTSAISLEGQGDLGLDLHDFSGGFGGGYTSGINVEAIGTTDGDFGIQSMTDNTTGSQVDAVRATGMAQSSNGTSADYVIAAPASAVSAGGSPVMAIGNADATHYSNGITIKNGAFATAGAVQPAGKIIGIDANAANTTVTINNPLCTSDAIIMLTPTNDDGAKAQWYVLSTSDGSFVIENHSATGAATASNVNYFIITPVNR